MKKLFFIIIISIIISISTVQAGWLDPLTSKEEEKVFTIKELNLEMVKCPADSFMMGSREEEYAETKKNIDDFHKKKFEFEYNEKLHLVTITKPFYIGKFEITQSQYEKIMGKNPSDFKNPNNPVENVTWEDAKLFCDKLNFKYLNILPESYKFALPTEAQWEYACRAGTITALNNWKNLTSEKGTCPNLDEVAWYNLNSNGTTHPVGKKKPNAWGIYDMHGNVGEWCKDWYGDYPNEYVKDPTGVNGGSVRVARGGSWDFISMGCRSAVRNCCDPDGRNNGLGFRVVLVPVK